MKSTAHCDIPCGIYDPIAAKIAAQTVLKMVVRIEAMDESDMSAAAGNSFLPLRDRQGRARRAVQARVEHPQQRLLQA